jgi:hypothetical protein
MSIGEETGGRYSDEHTTSTLIGYSVMLYLG